MGAVPKPIPLKLLEARSPNTTRGGQPMPEAPQFVRIAPKPPTFMSAEAKAEWKRVVPGLTRLDLTKEEDRAALVAYCECWSRFVGAQKIINEEGLLSTNSQGRVRHPAVAVVEAASKELRSWAQEFGLTPSAENRVARKATNDASEEDPFD